MLNFPSSSIQPPDNWAKRNRGARKGLVTTAAIILVLYILAFLSSELTAGFRRADLFVWLMLPDMLLSGLTGNAAATDSIKLGIGDRVLPLIVASLWLAAATWIGQALLAPLAKALSRVELATLSCLSGLSLLSTSVLLLGLAGFLTRIALAGTVLVWCGAAYWLKRRNPTQEDPDLSVQPPDQLMITGQIAIWLWRLIPVTVVVLAGTYLLNGLMPAFEFDVVEYHLQGPKEFYQAGRISFTAHNVYINMPLATEMHSLAMMMLVGGEDGWWLGGMAGKLIIATYSLLAAMLSGGFVSRYFGREAGWTAVAVLLSAPGSIHVAGCGLIDMALGAYAVASVILLQLFRQALQRKSASAGFVAVIACLLAGSAAACKYTGLIFVTLPVLVGLVALVGKSRFREWRGRDLAFCCLAFLTTVFPWYAKNLVATGNPVYPLASSLFGSGNLDETQVARWNGAHRVPRASDGSAFGWQSIHDSFDRLFLKSEYLSVALVPLTLMGFILLPLADRTVGAKRVDWLRHPTFLPLMMIFWIVFAWFAFTHRIDRFWIPALPMASMVAAVSVHWLGSNGVQSLSAAGLLTSTVYGLLIALSGIQSDNRWFVSYDSLRRDVGTEEAPGRLSVSIDWINRNLPRDANILAIGQAQAYRFERQIAYSTCFNTPPGELELRGVDAEQQRSWLKQSGFTHLLIQWSEIDRYRSPGNYGFSTWPTSEDLRAMLASGLIRPVPWPVDSRSAELFEVIDSNAQKASNP